ncbi:putative membrane protein [Breznakia sp. PF5-3]|uniref:ECF transporter S component n=1 Tax=unclassified Breznakia TaxID=2623764 RepID=UPI002406F53E|nr:MULTISPECIES: ECF transporter S component [unclassified Breznakia]MDF9825557.1 putative membrane protein [Breznakia sp. PM6-1]MDF9835864.1 putative membrane protein [Breznakia sp. PF5-3]MDF9837609.1 putative membrane protein [Breznakia sp. PFB2-8]MDF9860010.1 putative membrane protein [Breznakia sp. PH5-24]
MKKTNMKRFTLLALFIAIEIAVSVIPFLGFIPLGFINATTLHIPVIVAAILLGKKEGAIVGFVFGLISLIKHTLEPSVSSFIFSPFITIGGTSGNFASLLIAIVPRTLIGFLSGFLYEILSKRKINDVISISISAVVGSLTNTILVLGGIVVFFGRAYADAIAIPYNTLLTFIMGIVTSSGIIEAIVAAIIAVAICKAGKRVLSL